MLLRKKLFQADKRDRLRLGSLRRDERIRFIKFCLVGVSNTTVTWCVFFVLIKLGVYYLLSNAVAYSAGMINGFLWSKRWVFKERRRQIAYLIKFVMVNLVTLSLNTGLLYFFVSIMGLDKFLSLAFVTGIGLFFNYSGNRLWTFARGGYIWKESQTNG